MPGKFVGVLEVAQTGQVMNKVLQQHCTVKCKSEDIWDTQTGEKMVLRNFGQTGDEQNQVRQHATLDWNLMGNTRLFS
jgi:hypothetical protein